MGQNRTSDRLDEVDEPSACPPSATGRRSVLYFGNHWAAENRTSSHHIALELSRYYDVHYIECPGLRSPTASSRDVSKILSKCRSAIEPPRRVSDSLCVHTLLQLPFHRSSSVRSINRWLIRERLKRIVQKQRLGRPILWFTVPHVASLAGAIEGAPTVYYCIDDYAALPGIDERAVTEMDRWLTQAADVVFVASATLLDSKKELNEHAYVSPHGVDLDHFASALDEGEVPSDVRDLPRPVIGFFGLIEEWIDLDLVEHLAKRRPSWTFVMIGRVAVAPHAVMRLANVHFLGQRPYTSLPSYGRAFDVAIIPYRLNRQVMNANPLKLREYLAMGKRTVSVRTPEVEKFADHLEIADGYDAFLEKLDASVAGDAEHDPRACVEAVADWSWRARVADVLRVVDGYLGEEPSVPVNEHSLAR